MLPEEVKSGSVVEIALTLLHEITLTELQPLEEGRADQLNLEMANRRLILRALRESRGVIGGPHGAAARLGIKRTTLNSKLKKLNIVGKDYQ